MANALYDKGRQGFLEGAVDWDTDDIRCLLVDTGTYTVDLANHDNLDDVTGVVATSGSLTGKTVTNGVADADDVTFTAVTGATVEALVIYKHTGTAATSRLIAYLDTGTGLPVTPNGGNITVQWDNGANRIFKL
jgi:ApbE superfamily uncharacterized protein (UPF0280 family)